MDRPVVVDSLLCFINNFRHHPHLEFLTREYFSTCVNAISRQTLIDLLSESNPSTITENSSIFELYDQVMNLELAPIFVAADLTSLPIVLIGEESQSKNVFNEIHQLRFFIQRVLAGNEQTAKRLTSSTLSHLDQTEDNMESKAEDSCSSPVNPPAPSNNDCSPLFETANEESGSSTKSAAPMKTTPNKHSTRRLAPYRLDQAVRKLTDRLEAKKEDKIIEPPPKTPEVKKEVKQEVPESSQEKSSPVENWPITSTSQMPNNFFNAANLANPSSGIDPLAFLMLKNFANSECSLSNFGNDTFLKKNGQINDADGISEDDDEEKMSNESSPTPSDSSNGKDYGKDSDKPFSCGQANCNKRFANKFLLKKHQFIHTGLRPHICPFCAKRFNRKDNLLRHKKTHLANANLPPDGRRRHHALLSPAPLDSLHAFNAVNLLQISQSQNLIDNVDNVL
uniref:C2H2-type domain-containing protein n=1 Tax=Panagrolaimus sp. JU765 TaxID=591449 RepID=A0AC34Q2H4_9BILA